MSQNYHLVETMPSVEEYMRLRTEAGLSSKSRVQTERAINGTLYGCHFRLKDDEAVAMGRIIGDGGWYYIIADIATLPSHQRRGLGKRVMETLMGYLKTNALEGSLVTLTADPPGVGLYKKFGFGDLSPSLGMKMVLQSSTNVPRTK